ncbi:MAG: endopeptidase La [Candidatus Omnitrophica bacterium]|nr:endopeptidase La [Candidatus Omnitrophota bacterium]
MTENFEERSDEMKIPKWLPIVPLNNAVLFPGATAPIAITNADAIRSVETAAKGSRLFAAISIRRDPNQSERKKYKHLYKIGTVALILRMMHGAEDVTQLVVRGLHKIRILSIKSENKIFWAQVEVIEEKAEESSTIEALSRQVAEQAELLIQKAPMIPDDLQGLPSSMQNPHRLCYMVLSLTRTDMHRLQEIYEVSSLEEKLRLTLKEISHEQEIIDLGGKIHDQIQSKLSKSEREYYLREQLQAIRKELGETDDDNADIEELRLAISQKQLPKKVQEKADAELKRLSRMSINSPEYPMARNYLDWLLEYPWLIETEDKINIQTAERILNRDHYDLKQVKDRILELLAVRKLNPDIKGSILCFVGPPGVGKTSLGQSIARAMGRKFVRMSLGGMHDEAEIRGHRRTYIGALPGAIVQQMRRAGSNNPVFMLDEIDKVGQDFRGDPSSALLEVLDPQQNHSFRDHYMEIDIDLSRVLFIATANTPDRIQPALLDRMETIRLAGYTTFEKEQIAERYLIPRSVKNNGLSPKDIDFGVGALNFLIRGYTREAGVRNLEREIQSICRKVAVRKTKNRWKKCKITPTRIREFLSGEIFHDEVKRRTASAGVATGLAWTSVGGEILFVEALAVPGSKGGVLLTGKLGDVMKESARAALSLVRSRQKKLGIAEDFFNENEIHLHVPAGAVPKDGPSAGITMATAVASIATGFPIRNDMAMTGEITLSGLVLPIGGLKEKILAAHRSGIKNVIIPSRNQSDLDDIDKAIRKDMNFILVNTIDDVLKHSLKNSTDQKPEAKSSKNKNNSTKNSQRKSPGKSRRKTAAHP